MKKWLADSTASKLQETALMPRERKHYSHFRDRENGEILVSYRVN